MGHQPEEVASRLVFAYEPIDNQTRAVGDHVAEDVGYMIAWAHLLPVTDGQEGHPGESGDEGGDGGGDEGHWSSRPTGCGTPDDAP